MNAILEIINPLPEPPPSPEPPDTGGPDASHRGRGKIACLPKKVRDQLNQMLDDGIRYAQIKENLGEHGKDLTSNNISEWKKRGYQHWLKQQFWREEMRARMDVFTDLLGDTDPAQLPMAGLQMSLTQLCEQLRDVGPGSRKDQFEADADKYLRMLNTLSRLSKSLLTLQKFQRDSAAAAAVELKRLDPDRKLSDRERHAIVRQVDEILGLPSMDDSSSPEDPQPTSVRPASPPSSEALLAKEDPSPTIETPEPQLEGLADISRGSESGERASASGSSSSSASSPATESNPQSTIEIHPAPSGTKTPESCYDCGAQLPPLLPNGERPSYNCPACTARLYPPGTVFDKCPYCEVLQPLSSNNEWHSPTCRCCRNLLPPPGQRFATHCPACQAELPALTYDGARVSDRCPECRAPVPLLDPAA